MNLYRIFKVILSNVWISAFIFALIGIYISFAFKLTMDKGVWFNFFSSIAQTFGAFTAIVAAIMISRLELYNNIIPELISMARNVSGEKIEDVKRTLIAFMNEADGMKKREKHAKYLMINTIKKTALIMSASIILMPFGSVSIEYGSVLNIWDNLKLEWFFVFGMVGFCTSTLYNISFSLLDFFSERG